MSSGLSVFLARHGLRVLQALLSGEISMAEIRAEDAARQQALAYRPTGPNQMWQLDCTDATTASGEVWHITGVADCWSKYELVWLVSPTCDAVSALRLALADAGRLAGRPLSTMLPVDPGTGGPRPIAVVTGDGSAFADAATTRFIANRPELAPLRTWHDLHRQHWAPQRGLDLLKIERLYRHSVRDGDALAQEAERYRMEFNTQRPHEDIGLCRPVDVYLGRVTHTAES